MSETDDYDDFYELTNSYNELLEENKRLFQENKMLKAKLNLYRKINENKNMKKHYKYVPHKRDLNIKKEPPTESNETNGEIDMDFSYNENDNDIDTDNTNSYVNYTPQIYDEPKIDIRDDNYDTPFFRPEKNIKRKKYSILSKYRILQELNGNTPSQISKKYDIPITTLKGWIKNEDKYQNQILENKGNKERLVGGGRKVTDPEYETFLINWIKSERLKKHQVSYFRFIQFAKENYKGNLLTFSIGWLQKFLSRNGLSYRKRTSTCFLNENKVLQEIQEEFFPELYFFHLSNPNKTVYYNMDEIRIELDCISDKTIDMKGSRYIPIKTSNSERKSYTIALCISSEGKKLKPFILFDGVGTKLVKELDPKGAVIQFTQKVNSSYMTADLFKKWCERVYDAEVSAEEKEKSILFLDKCGSIHERYSPSHTTLIFFPANSTKFLQPLDLGVNKVVKGKFKQYWEKWMASNNKTSSIGHVKSMDRQTFIDAICEIWDSIETSVVINSFNEIKRGLKAIDDDYNTHLIEDITDNNNNNNSNNNNNNNAIDNNNNNNNDNNNLIDDNNNSNNIIDNNNDDNNNIIEEQKQPEK